MAQKTRNQITTIISKPISLTNCAPAGAVTAAVVGGGMKKALQQKLLSLIVS